MKTIKIKFVGYWQGFDYTNKHIYKLLTKHYDVQIVENDPEYVICSVFGRPYEYCKYPQVRIMYVGENYIPDFNVVDYGICNYPIKLQDRAFYFPFCLDEFGHCESLQSKDRNYSDEILKEKIYFANFIAGHESENAIRGNFFKKLDREYKRIESVGSYLNNQPDGKRVQWDNDSKREFQSKCKFTLCFESTKHEGFVTEKITDAFYADTIPIYYGSDNVKDIFNEKAFINCADYPDFESVLAKIKELDEDDEKYMEMLRQPIFVNPSFVDDTLAAFEKYLCAIFDQPLEKAYRRSRVYAAHIEDDFLRELNGIHKKPFRSSCKMIFRKCKEKIMHIVFFIKRKNKKRK
ncbi:MAG: hypothetical protein IJ345_00735 [Clostridia bacterium]|nr:hypothetical protein [Clostridia bacterium]